MKKRIPLQIIEGRLILTAVVECLKLRIHRQIMDFVMDTGSPDSYLSDKDVLRLQIPISDKQSKEEVNVGGSRFKVVVLPKFKTYLLEENKNHVDLDISLSALKTTKTSLKKIQTAQMLPSILGLDFLKEQKLSLHVVLSEDLANLEVD